MNGLITLLGATAAWPLAGIHCYFSREPHDDLKGPP